ncbi:hypothetical protein SALBM135S_08466 [Streptomyces alboniger]
MEFRWAGRAAALLTTLSAGALVATGVGGAVAEAAEGAYKCPARACFEVAKDFSKPWGVAVERASGKVYVADQENDMLYEVDPANGQKRAVLTEKRDLRNVDVAGPNLAYATTTYDDKVIEINLTNGRTTTVTSEITDPEAVAVTGDGTTAYVTSRSSDKLYEVSLKTGGVSTVASGLDAAGIALDEAGNAYVSTIDDDALYKIAVSSGKTEKITDHLGDPYGVAIDGAGTVFVSSDYDDKLVAVDPNTKAKKDVALRLDNPGGVAVDNNGRLYVTTDYDNKLWAVDFAAVPPVKNSAHVASEGAGEAKPNGFAHPAVKVTNTGKKVIGAERVVVTAGQGSKIAGSSLAWWLHGKQGSKECVRSADKMKLTCEEVPLNLEAQAKAKLWVTTKVDGDVEPGTKLKATYELGSPVFASGDSEYIISDR